MARPLTIPLPTWSVSLLRFLPFERMEEFLAVLRYPSSTSFSLSLSVDPPPIKFIWLLSCSSCVASACSIALNSDKQVNTVAYYSMELFIFTVVSASVLRSYPNLRTFSLTLTFSFFCFSMYCSTSYDS